MQVINNEKQQHVIITMDNEEVRELKEDLRASVRWYSSSDDGSIYKSDKQKLYSIMQFLEDLEKND